MSPTYDQIASDFHLWQEYVDTAGTTSREEFDAMPHADRIALQVEVFGPEPAPVPTVVDLLERTHVGWNMHRWPTQGGSITLLTAELRPALEAAYDPSVPDWPALVELADA